MLAVSKHNWISGTLDLSSKVRYGMTSRGVPIFRFIPYDKRFLPLAVGCSQRDLFYNVHAIVEPIDTPKEGHQLQRANLVKNLGRPTNQTEQEVMLVAYAYDNTKENRAFPTYNIPNPCTREVPFLDGLTFHIDPPGCKDVDDTFTIKKESPNTWSIAINIADLTELVQEGCSLDIVASTRATSFYTPNGEAIYPMLPKEVSEDRASLLPDQEKEQKPSLSLCFVYNTETRTITEPLWQRTLTRTTQSYTYDEANHCLPSSPELQTLEACASSISNKTLADSHEWVEKMMIFYNQKAGELLAKNRTGILRRHAESSTALIAHVGEALIPHFLFYESAEYCLASSETTRHFGLSSEFYAYASSPIRRYADLINQRAITHILNGTTPTPLTQDLVDRLNRRQKQAKAFSRDLFFMTNLSGSSDSIQGIVISQNPEKTKTKIWVPKWKRQITSRSLIANPLQYGTEVQIQWYEARDQARWKDRIVFKLDT